MASQVFQRQIFKPGDKIFKEGDDGNMAYLIREGEVENVKEIDGVKQVLGSFGQGGIFGEMAQIGSELSMAWARAASSTTIVCITQQMSVINGARRNPLSRVYQTPWRIQSVR